MVGLHPVAAAADDNDHDNKGCKQLSNILDKIYSRSKKLPTCSDGRLFAYLKMMLQHYATFPS
jgi:hypothetical protein